VCRKKDRRTEEEERRNHKARAAGQMPLLADSMGKGSFGSAESWLCESVPLSLGVC
jgi:hypothetical protein